jgi:hypothetical protein
MPTASRTGSSPFSIFSLSPLARTPRKVVTTSPYGPPCSTWENGWLCFSPLPVGAAASAHRSQIEFLMFAARVTCRQVEHCHIERPKSYSAAKIKRLLRWLESRHKRAKVVVLYSSALTSVTGIFAN